MENKNLVMIGDQHGEIRKLESLLLPEDSIKISLGDVGYGFVHIPEKCKNMDYFIRGNHDSPEECKKSPKYLGNYGYNEELDLFYLSGAWSIDWQYRKEGISWWRDEELSIQELNSAYDLYCKIKPELMISHDGPWEAVSNMKNMLQYGNGKKIETRTGQCLDAMLEFNRPKFLIFGHYHENNLITRNGTSFVCLGELSTITLDRNKGLGKIIPYYEAPLNPNYLDPYSD